MYIYINAQEDVRILTRDEFRIFELYVLEHYQDMYSHKVGYDVHFDKLKDTFTVTLPVNDVVNFVDIFNERGWLF